MQFKQYLETLAPVEEYAVEIELETGEIELIEPVEGKLGSLRLLQNHLGDNDETHEKFDLTNFCEFYEEWKQDPDGHHTTIAFLDKYNEVGGVIRK